MQEMVQTFNNMNVRIQPRRLELMMTIHLLVEVDVFSHGSDLDYGVDIHEKGRRPH